MKRRHPELSPSLPGQRFDNSLRGNMRGNYRYQPNNRNLSNPQWNHRGGSSPQLHASQSYIPQQHRQHFMYNPVPRNSMNQIYRPELSHNSQHGSAWLSGGSLQIRNTGPLAKNIFPSKKRKKQSEASAPPTRVINLEDAAKALQAENELISKSKQLVIWFPDPPLDREMVHGFHDSIKKVYFRQPSTPRSCFVQLSEDADIDDIIRILRNTKFGNGYLKVELKHETYKRDDKPEDIDPYVLFIGNISMNTPADTIKKLFSGARIDIGPSDKIKKTRYAFARFNSVDESIKMLRSTYGTMVCEQSLNIRYRRLKAAAGMPGESKVVVPCPSTATSTSVDINTIKDNTNISPNQSKVLHDSDFLKTTIKEEVDDYQFDCNISTYNYMNTYNNDHNIKQEYDAETYDEQLDPGTVLGTELKEEPCYSDTEYNEEENEAYIEQFVEKMRSSRNALNDKSSVSENFENENYNGSDDGDQDILSKLQSQTKVKNST